MTLRKLIEKRLEKTLDCQMKKDWFPKGWACVKIKKFSEEMAGEIKQAQFLNQLDEEKNDE